MAHWGSVAPFGAAPGHFGGGTVDAYGKPVYKKKWLFGKWKYAGLRDVHYVPRPAAVPFHTDVHVDTHCAPAVACGPSYGHCATGFDAHCGTPAWGGACGTGFDAGCAPCF